MRGVTGFILRRVDVMVIATIHIIQLGHRNTKRVIFQYVDVVDISNLQDRLDRLA